MNKRITVTLIIAVFVALVTVFSIFNAPEIKSNTNRTNLKEDKLTFDLVKAHDNEDDCWTVIDGQIYDITKYIKVHPGGNIISKACGFDGTQLFETKGGSGREHSDFAKNLLKDFFVGSINETTNTTGATGGTGSGGTNIPTIQEVIEKNYPGATIKEINTEDSGNSEVQINYNGENMTVWLDSNHNLI